MRLVQGSQWSAPKFQDYWPGRSNGPIVLDGLRFWTDYQGPSNYLDGRSGPIVLSSPEPGFEEADL